MNTLPLNRLKLTTEQLVALVYLWSRDGQCQEDYIADTLGKLAQHGHFEFSDHPREEMARRLVGQIGQTNP